MTNARNVFALPLAALLLAPSVVTAHEGHSHAHQEASAETKAAMLKAARQFLATLDKEQKEKATFEWNSDRREKWAYLPDKFIKPEGKRFGLAIEDMKPEQRLWARGLVQSALTNKGHLQVLAIQSLEAVLFELENGAPHRKPELYYVSIFGTPSESKSWGWRFEGHHLSLNVMLIDGKTFSVTPSFFGTNPAEVLSGPRAGLRVIADEEDFAYQLIDSMSPEQLEKAVFQKRAPADVITKAKSRVSKDDFLPAKGIRYSELSKDQQAMLHKLIGTYTTDKYADGVISQFRARRKTKEQTDIHFAWAGSTTRGEKHYYRIQTPEFLFELDNTQNGANHIHAVWRDFNGDFGRDLLGDHHKASHSE
ncbi:DUF3500 domain-containing protein [Stratiformator vulcanicus]|uniref:DUF3500 domain-containing protein n=1 Tax=Stratiformator vulcanicus TaxID=2527980 RepID=A0A517R7S3_9PLAN|nr:DUF3500 domain-containing protein [Stratiformator vulcanicus]QDT39940.1 hypothetical protein Pan189_43520 [Stratiformator vulcanicus]